MWWSWEVMKAGKDLVFFYKKVNIKTLGKTYFIICVLFGDRAWSPALEALYTTGTVGDLQSIKEKTLEFWTPLPHPISDCLSPPMWKRKTVSVTDPFIRSKALIFLSVINQSESVLEQFWDQDIYIFKAQHKDLYHPSYLFQRRAILLDVPHLDSFIF